MSIQTLRTECHGPLHMLNVMTRYMYLTFIIHRQRSLQLVCGVTCSPRHSCSIHSVILHARRCTLALTGRCTLGHSIYRYLDSIETLHRCAPLRFLPATTDMKQGGYVSEVCEAVSRP